MVEGAEQYGRTYIVPDILNQIIHLLADPEQKNEVRRQHTDWIGWACLPPLISFGFRAACAHRFLSLTRVVVLLCVGSDGCG